MVEAILVASALDAWLGDLQLQDRANTARTYRSMLKPLRALEHSRRLADTNACPTESEPPRGLYLHELNPEVCRELAADRLRAGMTPNTLRNWVAILSAFAKYCVERGWCPTNFAAGVPKPKRRKVLRRYLTPAQARSVWMAARDDYDRLGLLLMAGSGLRVAECAALRLRDCDFTHGTVRVYGKGSKWREVVVDARAMGMIQRLKAPALKAPIPYPVSTPAGSRDSTTDRIFPFEPPAFRRRVARMGRAAGIPWLHPHALRHCAAQQFLAAGGDSYSLMAMLGHSDPATTAIYVEDQQAAISLQRQREIGLAARLF